MSGPRTPALEAALRCRPPPETLRWAAEAVGSGARVTSIRRLRGGTSTAMHAINVADVRGHTHPLVLRRFVLSDWLANEPDLVEREISVLQRLEETEVPAPKLVAADPGGSICDVPAVLMTRLPGRVDFAPDNMTSWLTQLASLLPVIHAVGGRGTVRPYRPYNDVRTLEPPTWSRHTDVWERALALLSGPPPEEPDCFLHRDYHPGNLLWVRGRVTGVVDWINASWGPAPIDVGHCRLNLATLHGVEIADQFLALYQSLAGGPDYHPYWDIITAIEWLPEPGTFPGWHDAGLRGITAETVQARLDEHVAAAVARLS